MENEFEQTLSILNSLNPQLALPEETEHCRPVHRLVEGVQYSREDGTRFDADGTEVDYTREPRHYLGAGDVPTVLGLNSWASPFSLWQRKMGLVDRDPMNEPMEWGLNLEPLILHKLGQELGVPVSRHNHVMKSKRWPWLGCLPDGLADQCGVPGAWSGFQNPPAWVQAKNCAGFETWQIHEDGKLDPMRVWVQLQAELAVSGDPWEYVVALLHGNAFRWARVPRDDQFIEETMVPACETFILALEEEREPPVDGSDATKRALVAMFPKVEKGSEVTLPASFIDLDDEYRTKKAEAKELTERTDEIANQARYLMKGANHGRVQGRGGYWNKFTVKASTYTVNKKESQTCKRQPPKKDEADGWEGAA